MTRLLTALFLLCGCANAGDQPPSPGGKASAKAPAPVSAAADRFSCRRPAGWEAKNGTERERAADIQKLELLGPRADKAPVMIYASFYGQANQVFAGYEDFIERNSKNILGETESETEKFGPVKKTILSGRKVFAFDSEIKEYLDPESKAGDSVVIKEKFYVEPAKGGFFVLHYYAPASVYKKYLPVFREFSASCRVR